MYEDSYLSELEYTENAWENLYDTVDSDSFLRDDASLIYEKLQSSMRLVSFGEYLQRYIYRKAELTEPFSEIPIKEYVQIIRDSFYDNLTPFSFTPTSEKPASRIKHWLTQRSVSRSVVFLLGFGLRMSTKDVNSFLTKALEEPALNPKDPFEVICWYCYEHRYGYAKCEELWKRFSESPKLSRTAPAFSDEYTVGVRTFMYGIESDEDLFAYLERLKTTEAGVFFSVTAWECFKKLYGRSCELLAEDYNREEAFQGRERRYTGEEMSEGDLEKALCSAVPRDRHGNLSPAKASKLHAQFEGKRFSRQHINEILHRNAPVTRFDLITLNFYIFSYKVDEISNSKELFSEYISSTNAILESCSMDELYVQNPYESFILMCLLSVDPLGTYGEVWEKSFSMDP